MKRFFTTLFCFLLINTICNAQVKLIASFYKPDPSRGDVSAKSFQSGNKLFFSADDYYHGRELWVTTGTPEGTHMVKDINPNPFAGSIWGDNYFTGGDLKGVFLFGADDGIKGQSLWRSDGTAPGTRLVKNILPGHEQRLLTNFVATDSVMFFVTKPIFNFQGQRQLLWRTNGTAEGTYLIDTFNVIQELAVFKNELYFSAASARSTDQGLWKVSDSGGTPAFLKNFAVTSYYTNLGNFHATTTALYFAANTFQYGWELWKTTGTADSTSMVKDLNPNGNSVADYYDPNLKMSTSIGKFLYFRAKTGHALGYDLFKTDGTDSGTIRVSRVPGDVGYYNQFPKINGKILFYSTESAYYWQYDPATKLVTETRYPAQADFSLNYGGRAAEVFLDSVLFFESSDSLHGYEMWFTDGKQDAPRRLQETSLFNNLIYYSNSPWYDHYPFNAILGTLGRKVIFAQQRSPYDGSAALFSYDISLDSTTAFPPSILIAVKTADNEAQLVWNRIESAVKYQVRYRPVNENGRWQSKIGTKSFTELAVTPGIDYHVQLRSFANNNWTLWSDTFLYKPDSVYRGINLILADRADGDTVVNIYWRKTLDVPEIELRYRIHGYRGHYERWKQVTNSTGFIRLNHLEPGTFYEYKYRSSSSGNYRWPSGPLYNFLTPNTQHIAQVQFGNNDLLLSPNPVKGLLYINSKFPANAYFTVTDVYARVLKTGTLTKNTIDVSQLPKGIYTVTIAKDNFKQSGKVIKE